MEVKRFTCVASSVVGQTFINVSASGGSHASPFVTGVASTISRTRRIDALMGRHAAPVVRITLVDVDAPRRSDAVTLPTGITLARATSGRVGARCLWKDEKRE